MFEALVAPPPGASQAELLRGSTCRSPSSRTPRRSSGSPRELVETKAADGSATSRSAGGRCSSAARPGARRRHRGRCRGARERGARTGAVRLICTALRTHEPARTPSWPTPRSRFRDLGLTGWDLAGPEAAYPIPLPPRAPSSRRASRWPADHAPRRRMGRRRPGPAALALDPERIAHGPGAVDDPELMAELIRRRVTLDLCPTEQRPGRHRGLGRGPPARPPPSGRRPGQPLDRRCDRLRHPPVRRIRAGRRRRSA